MSLSKGCVARVCEWSKWWGHVCTSQVTCAATERCTQDANARMESTRRQGAMSRRALACFFVGAWWKPHAVTTPCRRILVFSPSCKLQGAPGSHSQNTAVGTAPTWPPASANRSNLHNPPRGRPPRETRKRASQRVCRRPARPALQAFCTQVKIPSAAR